MGSGSLGRELDLNAFVTELESNLGNQLEADLTSSGMATIRLDKDGPAYLVYRTGSFQIRGPKSVESLFNASDRLRDVLDRLGVNIPDYKFNHVTSVFLESLDLKVDLDLLMISLGVEYAEYEPEQFPGLIYRPPDHEVSLLIFSSGKVIIGGTTDREKATSAIKALKNKLSNLT